MSELRQLACYVAELNLEKIPEPVRDAAALCVLDSVAAALGAVNNDQIRKVSDLYDRISGSDPACSCWGRNRKMPVLTAIFLNSMLGHTLELDDVHTRSKTHIGTVVVPAAWNLAEYLGRSGRDFLEAVICGYEVMSRIGMGFGVASHRNKGWHVTATAGTFGAAAAAAKLLRLNEEQTLSAFGMAGTQSFGLWAFLGDGASCKVLHPARAAVSGTEAALLAQSGMSGPEHILDAFDGGLFAAMSDASDLTLVARDLGSRFELLYMDKKPYPCCRSTHCAIDAALAIKGATGITADEIKSVHIDTYLVGYKQCGISEGSIQPGKPIDAKFSTPYAVAAAFLYGEVSLRQFNQESIDDPAIQTLVNRITVASADRFTRVYPAHWGCALYVTCKDGRVLEKEVPDASGSVANPLNKKQVKAKARALIREVYPVQAEAIGEMILSISSKLKIPSL